MPRATGQKEYTSLLQGLVTEASPLSFPEGATAGELNFVVNKDGLLRERRRGFSSTYASNTTFADSDARLDNMFYWRGSGYVVAVLVNSVPETYLRFHAVDSTFSSLLDIKIADADCETQVAELTNFLVITLSNGADPVILEFDPVTSTVEVSSVNIHVRDFELVDDGLSASEHPSTLTDNHHYNLLNAGWHVFKKDETTAGNPRDSVIDIYFDEYAEYPSNADVVSLGVITNSDGALTFDPEYVRDAGLGNSLAPRGHYVYDIEDFDRDARVASPSTDGTPATTLTLIGSADFSGDPTYNPDDPSDGGGGGTDPGFDPYPGCPPGEICYEEP